MTKPRSNLRQKLGGRGLYYELASEPYKLEAMCGIAGFVSSSLNGGDSSNIGKRMASALSHRGPDDSGVWTEPELGVTLSHRRLSILDLTSAGHQPMPSPSARFMMTYNGEIYNFQELKDELSRSGREFRTRTDTEVLLVGFETWGIEATLKKTVGMFALAVWDNVSKRLFLARDRFGEKPLFYGSCGKSFLFASELKAIRVHPDFDSRLDEAALLSYFRYNYFPAPASIYQGIKKLQAGHLLTYDPESKVLNSAPYWSLRDEMNDTRPFEGSEEEAKSRFNSLMRNAVKRQMVSDVPLGAFLSGGIDSSLIVALMQQESSRKVRTFSVGFRESSFNEAHYASEVAKHLGTDHSELIVSDSDAMQVVPKLAEIYDEPFADSSQIPTYLVSQLARQSVTVSLSGDAGDELFGGYTRYRLAPSIWSWTRPLPAPVRGASKRSLDLLSSLLPLSSAFRSKLGRFSQLIPAKSDHDLYRSVVSHWDPPGLLSRNRAQESQTHLDHPSEWPALKSFEERMMYLDLMTYLTDDILVKVDRAAMAVSLETRVPFLDRDVVKFSHSLPLAMKIRGGVTKWLPRSLLDDFVPRALVDRPKMGFGIPLASWLRSGLRDWAEDLLSERSLGQSGLLEPAPIREAWLAHSNGRRDYHYHLWGVLMFQSWLRRNQN